MGRLTAYLLRQFRTWDRSAQMAMILALALLLLIFSVIVWGPPHLRQPALIGFFGLVLSAQIIFMWGNRGMVTPYTQAQRCYLAEDFDSARQILENLWAADQADFRALTLLGNTYRQLGRLDESYEVLTKALDLRPSDPFPLYGIGRTLLIKGFYAEAADILNHALAAGAPPLVALDRAEALYRQGLYDEAQALLVAHRALATEPHRALMADYLLYRLSAGQVPARSLVESGLSYWRDHARRFHDTLYGQSLLEDVRYLETLVQEE